jgi:hypothetical protein
VALFLLNDSLSGIICSIISVWISKKQHHMTKTEAIKLARQLSSEYNPLSVVFDKDLNDFFISEGDVFFIGDDFYEKQSYEIIAVFK